MVRIRYVPFANLLTRRWSTFSSTALGVGPCGLGAIRRIGFFRRISGQWISGWRFIVWRSGIKRQGEKIWQNSPNLLGHLESKE